MVVLLGIAVQMAWCALEVHSSVALSDPTIWSSQWAKCDQSRFEFSQLDAS